MNQTGVNSKMRMNRVVKAGLVVAAVAVVWVLRKSVSRKRGSSRMLHRAVNVCKVSRISSRLFLCFSSSEPPRLCVFFFFLQSRWCSRADYIVDSTCRM